MTHHTHMPHICCPLCTHFAAQDDPNNRGEAKSWLIYTVAHLQHDTIPSTARLACFDPCSSPSSSSNRRGNTSDEYYATDRHRGSSREQQQQSPVSSCKPAVLQLLQLLCDAQPQAVAQLLSKDADFLCSYLTSSPAVTSSWFGHFSLAGIQHFKFGARALANYALTHRTEVWQYLVWAGKHDQAPVAVAGKPHYFAELDIDRTMRQLARHCPEFWCSDELLRSCEGGEWLQLDPGLVSEV